MKEVKSNIVISISSWSYCVQSQVALHVIGRDPVQDSSTSNGPKTLSYDVEESPEQRHLRADQVGKSDSWIDVSSADVADGLDEGGSRQPEAERDVKNIDGAGGPAEGRTQPKEDKEHGAVELGEHRPPERHWPDLPHGATQ